MCPLILHVFIHSPQILERSIKLLFETRDISQVKQFVQRQCVKVLDGRASMQDLTFAKEYRGSGSYRPGACVPALELTRCVCVCRQSVRESPWFHLDEYICLSTVYGLSCVCVGVCVCVGERERAGE